ncbi:carbohydrate ABC transporter permease [Streptomyces sp. NRRL WC-3742]|uniref:carbohydrate ABC transporter permease n=1 Tax=Streptomyces sp. NRRL WC-3742 TaxID=1463934 RepID=UPI00068BE128
MPSSTRTDEAVEPAVRTPVRTGGAPGRRRVAKRATPYLLIAPMIGTLLLVLGYPLLDMVLLSFKDMTRKELFSGESPAWVGLDQYRAVLSDGFFWVVVARTVAFAAVCAGLTMLGGLGFAMLLRTVSRWVRVIIVGVLVAVWAMPFMVAASVFRWLTDADYGVANWALGELTGSDFRGHNWFNNPWEGYAVIVAVVVWGAIPFAAITLHAAVVQVPPELEEAARVDGARGPQVFRHVTFPMIRPLFVVVAALSAIWDFGVFSQIWLMRGGQPERDYYLLGVYSFIESFAVNRYSAGAAIAILTVLLLLVGSAVYLRQILRTGEVE